VLSVLDLLLFPVWCFVHAHFLTGADGAYGGNFGRAGLGEKRGFAGSV
jgi:hypothetical protein